MKTSIILLLIIQKEWAHLQFLLRTRNDNESKNENTINKALHSSDAVTILLKRSINKTVAFFEESIYCVKKYLDL